MQFAEEKIAHMRKEMRNLLSLVSLIINKLVK